MKTYLGIEIGGTKLQIVVGNENAQITKRFQFSVDQSAGAEGIRHHIAETLKDLKGIALNGIGVGFGGPINRITGKVWTSYHIEGWSDFSLRDWLKDLSGVNVAIDNDANVAALGESCYGAGKDYNIVFYVTLGSGVGGGLCIENKIYHGALPGETEMGHIRLDKSGRTVQSSCSGWAVDQKIREFVKKNSRSKLAQLTKGMKNAEAKVLTEAIGLKDPDATNILNETVDDLALGLSHAVHLLHPATIVIGGGLSLIGEPLRYLAQQKLTPYIMDAFQPGPVIQLSILKADAVPIGALRLAMQNFELLRT